MDRNFARALALVLKSEGGWSDNPADPGGTTMKGVTLANFRRYVKADATKADLRKISDEQVGTVYRRFYWDAVAGAELPGGVDYAVFDFAVNSGPGRAAKYLQAIVGANQDGRIGPATLSAVQARPAGAVIDALCDARLAFLMRLPTWPTFGRGWSERVGSVRAQALLLSASPAAPTPDPSLAPPRAGPSAALPAPTGAPAVPDAPGGRNAFWRLVSAIFKIILGGKPA
ncbi:glycoside hydrolase family 108 protein [Mesorhizobium sp. IMUNJ 23033]|uniref:glycoside hydrolase family 108 protein n=1 Tax=Mesorhizobium sp. IMUNJ 23033 TaxID=3378039 RepID=UPI003850FC79